MSRRTVLPALVATLLFALVTLDLARELQLLSTGFRAVAAVIGLVGLFLLLRHRSESKGAPTLFLLLGALVALGISAESREENWAEERDVEARRVAAGAAAGFAELSEAARITASRLAAEPVLAEALRFTDPRALSDSFSLLSGSSLPRADEGGVPGVTLFDASLRPIAWAGENRPLEGLAGVRHGVPGSSLLVLRRSAETSIVAVHPLGAAEGFVVVEVPIAADRRLENRYLEDYDAISAWTRRSVDADFLSSDAEREEARERFASEGDPYWSGAVGSPRLVFGLRSAQGDLLGIGSAAAEPPEAAMLEERRRVSLRIAVVLVLASGLALFTFIRSRPRVLLLLPAVWGFRLVLRASHFPLGLGLGLDNPADYASSLFFGLAHSPIDFLLTMATLLASAWLLSGVASRGGLLRGAGIRRLLAPAVCLLLFIGVQEVVLDAWRNSNLALAEVLLASFDPPRLTVQLGLLALFLSATYLGYLLLSGKESNFSRGPVALFLAFDAVLVLAAFLALSPRGYGDHVLLAAIPLFVVHLLALHPDRLRSVLGRPAVLALVLLVAAVSLFYPSVARFESVTIRNFIESTVSPTVLQHRRSPESVLVETALDVDAMYEEGRLGDFGREDLAFGIWVATDLSASSLSSSVEIVDPARRVVSRFALSFPPLTLEDERRAAPAEWIKEEGRHPAAPEHPGYMTARRTFLGTRSERWEIRIRVAADWRNLPFIVTTDPYLRLFRAAAVEAPLRFPHQELELIVMTHGGRPVFQSVGGNLQPGEALLTRALGTPFWWEHPHEGQIHLTYLVGDDDYVYALSYPEKPPLAYGAELALWFLLAAIVAALALGFLLLLRALGSEAGVDPAGLFAGIRKSFPAKLYAAFVLVALVPIASLAFLIHGIVIRDLERDVEREAVERAQLA
ncbi:MAG: hypothetical protein ACRD21_02245, partial [Vicinamibacteria bacterium]